MRKQLSLIFLLCCMFVAKGQVNLQKGTLSFTIPICNFTSEQDRIGTSVSLSYAGGNGIKTNELSGDVGLGWSLNYGGVIVRQQRGEPDDQKNETTKTYEAWKGYYGHHTYQGTNNTPQVNSYNELSKVIFGNGYLFNNYNPETPVSSKAVYTPGYEKEQHYTFYELGYKPSLDLLDDKEQDIFSFTINGRSGSFLLSKTGGFRFTEDSRLRLSYELLDMSANNVRTRIKSFTITDEDGIQYKFNDYSLEKLSIYFKTADTYYHDNGPVLTPYTVILPMHHRITKYEGTPIDQYVINKWYLSDIINPKTQKKIHFEYETYNLDFISGNDIQYTTVPNSSNGDVIAITKQRAISTEKRIKNIEFLGYKNIEFEYALKGRVDLPGANHLTKIKVIENNNLVNYHFGYGYFVKKEIKSPEYTYSNAEKKAARLCLLSLQKKSAITNDEEEPYTFEYYTGLNSADVEDYVPPRLAITTDNFGYYNGLGSQSDDLLQPSNFNNLSGMFALY
jgi:hypothetical protein